jgi:small subunit ribosomal protein S16
MVRIRLRRTGRKKQPTYRIVVADSSTPREGAYLEAVGTYNPRTTPAELRLDLERVDEWLGRGAELTDTVASLVRKARKGGDAAVALKAPQSQPQAAAQPVPAAAAVKPEPTIAAVKPEPAAAAAEPEPAAAAAEPTDETAEA